MWLFAQLIYQFKKLSFGYIHSKMNKQVHTPNHILLLFIRSVEIGAVSRVRVENQCPLIKWRPHVSRVGIKPSLLNFMELFFAAAFSCPV